MSLKEYGFNENKPNVWTKVQDDGTVLVHDFRKGKRQSYAIKDGKSVDVHGFKDYKIVKDIEEIYESEKLNLYKL